MTATAKQDQKDIVRGFGTNFLGFLAKFGARAPFLFIAGSLYGSHSFGRFVITIAIIETLAAISTLGLKRSLFKFLDDDVLRGTGSTPEATISSTLILVTGIAAIFGLAVFFCADLIAGLISEPGDAMVLRLLSPIIPLLTLAEILLAATRFRRTVRYEVLARSIVEPLTLMLTALAFYFLDLQQFGLFFAYGLSILGAFGVAAIGIVKVFSFKSMIPAPGLTRRILGIFKFTAPTAFNDLVTILLFRVDVFIISHFCSSADLGIYGMAQQFATSVQKVHESFNPIVAPVVSSLIARGPVEGVRHQLAQVSRWIFSLQLAIVVGIFFYGDTLLTIVGKGYAAGGVALTFLVLAEMLNGSFGVADLPLLFKRPIFNPIVTSIGFAVQAALCFWLIPLMGINGAALSLALTYFLMNFMRVMLLFVLFRILILEWTLLRPIFAGAVNALLILALRHVLPLEGWHEVAVGVPATLSLYAVLMLIFGFPQSERQQLALKYPRLGWLLRLSPI